MSAFILYVRTHFTTLLLYVVAFVVVLLLYPVEGRFPYEFRQGKPWMHNDLYAPFDIPVRKTDEEIRLERDSIARDERPYYNYLTGADSVPIRKFRKGYEALWPSVPWDTVRYDSLRLLGELWITRAYDRGIYSAEDADRPGKSGVVIRNNVGEAWDLASLLTPREAYEYILAGLESGITPEELDFFRALNLHELIAPNLVFNAEVSGNVRAERIRTISLTKGLIPEGRRIIGQGEMVSGEKLNHLLSFMKEYEQRMGASGNLRLMLLGQSVLILFPFLMLYLFLYTFRLSVHRSFKDSLFILLLLCLMVGVACVTKKYAHFSLLILPYALLPIVLRTFFDSRLAFFVHTVAVVLIAPLLPNAFEFAFLQLVTGSIAIVSLKTINRRSALFLCIFWIVLSYWAIYGALQLIHGNSFQDILWLDFVRLLISAALVSMAYPLIFLFEKSFGYLSDVTLMELSDSNHPVLRKLAEVAPGTFQHSMQVANLAEEVVRKIGGNPLLVRAGAMYHDIGKIVRPMYFIENLASRQSPHDDLQPEESARIILEHVSRGVDYARKNGLPEKIIDFIRTHHGTTTVRFFYHQFQKQNPVTEQIRTKFTYPGPPPFSKEMVALMICDSVEAASRSLKDFNRTAIHELVDRVVRYQIEEDQYADADITYRDISVARSIVKNKLMNIYHVRVEYPEMKRPESGSSSEPVPYEQKNE